MRKVNPMLSALLIAAGAYGALVWILYLAQESLLYFPHIPSRTLIATPHSVGLAYETVQLTTQDEVRLHAWYIPARKKANWRLVPTLLFFHGNAGNISHRLDSLRLFHDLSLNVLIFDYRGYGQSEGRPSEEGTYLDALAAWRYLTEERQVSPQNIVLFGHSLGGAVAAWLAAQVNPGALILESTFTSIPDLAAELYWWLPARKLARLHYPTLEYLQKVRCPVLIVHSPEDEIIPYSHALALFEAAHSPKEFLKLKGDHNRGFLISGEYYMQGLEGFLTRHLSSRPN